jgi:hypothetical protein
MLTTYCTESLSEARPDLEMILPLHWEEIARDKEIIKLDPDWEAYEALDRAGQFFMMFCRIDGKMVGYHICFIRPHLHYRKSLSAITDIFYLLPEFRAGRTGIQLFVESEKALKARGVQKIFLGCKVSKDLTPLFEKLGYVKIEYVFSKVTND